MGGPCHVWDCHRRPAEGWLSLIFLEAHLLTSGVYLALISGALMTQGSGERPSWAFLARLFYPSQLTVRMEQGKGKEGGKGRTDII